MLGGEIYPFPETTDFSAHPGEGPGVRGEILGFCGAGADLVNVVKQAHEFGLTQTMNVAAMVAYTHRHSFDRDGDSAGYAAVRILLLGPERAHPRSFQKRIQPKVHAVAEHGAGRQLLLHAALPEGGSGMGAAAAKADGAATVAQMKAMPTDDDCFGVGRIREDGRKIHPVYLFECAIRAGRFLPFALYHAPGRGL